MTPEDLEALGRRAVAAGWRWRRGCVGRYLDAYYGTAQWLYIGDKTWVDGPGIGAQRFIPEGLMWPDFSDPATMGCLLALVREAHGCPEAHVYLALVTELRVVRWRGEAGQGVRSVHATTEAEALVAALEAASVTP